MKRLLLASLCLLPLIGISQSFRERFTEANLLTEDGFYGLSIPIWHDLLKEKPDNANLNYKLGLCYLNLGIDRDKALPYFRKASTDINRIYDPFSSDFKGAPVETYFYLGKALHITGELDSAENNYSAFLKDAGKNHYLRPEAEKALEMCANARELMSNPIDVSITNIGTPINSPFAEYSPIIAFDENALYYTSRRLRTDGSNESDIDVTTGLYYEDMYVSFRNLRGSWMEPELLNINLPNAHSSVVSMSHDGRTLYTYKTYSGDGKIYESTLEIGTGWTEPAMVGSDVNSKHNEYFAAITADQQRLYFVSDRPGGLGGKDIWYCNRLPNGEWGKSINLGKPINTPFEEDAPFIHPDGKTMYFSSTGHKSMGGYDIFRSTFEKESWSDPVNLGYPINTTDDDHSYITTPSGKRAYYSSKSSSSLGSTDIYIVEYPEEEQETQIDMSSFAVLKGWVLSPQPTLPSNFIIYVTRESDGQEMGQATPIERNGSFVFIIPSGDKYIVDYVLEDSTLLTETITIPAGERYTELSREIIISPDKRGRMEAVVLDESVLGKEKAWQVLTNGKEGIVPIGSKVYYLDINDNVLHTAYVSKDGFFEFKPLAGEQPLILKIETPGTIKDELEIVLINNTEDKQIELAEYEDRFIEKSKIPQPKTTERSVTHSPKSNKIPQSETPMPTDSKGPYTFYLDYNVTSLDESSKMFQALIVQLQTQIKESGTAAITIEGGASHVPTSRYTSNETLANLRADRAEKQLLEYLEKQGINTNKISTKSKKGTVSGPDFTVNNRQNKGLFSDFQYVKVLIN